MHHHVVARNAARTHSCVPCGESSAHTQKRACFARATTNIHTHTHIHVYTLAPIRTPARWHNTGKVACQTGIICNAAAVVVVGLKLHRDSPGSLTLLLPLPTSLPHSPPPPPRHPPSSFYLPALLFFPSVLLFLLPRPRSTL